MKTIPFTKMHGLGNDFILLNMNDLRGQGIELNTVFIQKICNRNFGIGSDGLLLLDDSNNADYKYIMYNPNGSYAEMCGNGIRCFMRYLHDRKITDKKRLLIETGAGVLQLDLDGDDVIVGMGIPKFERKSIGIFKENNINGDILSRGREFYYFSVSVGNPHAIIFLDEPLEEFDVEQYGASIESNTDIFENKVNVSFVEKISDTEINHRVYERGAGETLACGTAVTATISVGIKQGFFKPSAEIKVNLPRGELFMKWSGKASDSVFMRGKAETSFTGFYNI